MQEDLDLDHMGPAAMTSHTSTTGGQVATTRVVTGAAKGQVAEMGVGVGVVELQGVQGVHQEGGQKQWPLTPLTLSQQQQQAAVVSTGWRRGRMTPRHYSSGRQYGRP
jgi:hypothetical protein